MGLATLAIATTQNILFYIIFITWFAARREMDFKAPAYYTSLEGNRQKLQLADNYIGRTIFRKQIEETFAYRPTSYQKPKDLVIMHTKPIAKLYQ